MAATSVAALRDIATQLRIDSVASTSKAGSGHPTTCLSAADIMSVLFFSEMHFDPKNPQDPDNDRFVLSKGHAAPILYAAWAEAGLFPRERLMELRTFESDLEGHPTPRLPFVDVATGSLGQGICAAVGIALNARRIGSAYRTYALLGDGEIAEGSVWEAADAAAHYKLDNLCAIVDANALGQSQPTEFRHDLDRIAARWSAFGWKAIVVDGHDIGDIQKGLATARATSGQPTALVARTIKGKGLSAIAGKEGWHGKALKSGDETDKALEELKSQLTKTPAEGAIPGPRTRGRTDSCRRPATSSAISWRRARPGALRSQRSASSTPESSRSTRTSRTRLSAIGSRRWRPTASSRCSSPSRVWLAPRWASRRAEQSPSPRPSPVSFIAPRISSACRAFRC
jgi:transketolase